MKLNLNYLKVKYLSILNKVDFLQPLYSKVTCFTSVDNVYDNFSASLRFYTTILGPRWLFINVMIREDYCLIKDILIIFLLPKFLIQIS